MSAKTEDNGLFRVSKCPGIPLYPKKHSFYDKWLAELPEDYIKERKKRVEKFLEKFFRDNPCDGQS